MITVLHGGEEEGGSLETPKWWRDLWTTHQIMAKMIFVMISWWWDVMVVTSWLHQLHPFPLLCMENSRTWGQWPVQGRLVSRRVHLPPELLWHASRTGSSGARDFQAEDLFPSDFQLARCCQLECRCFPHCLNPLKCHFGNNQPGAALFFLRRVGFDNLDSFLARNTQVWSVLKNSKDQD